MTQKSIVVHTDLQALTLVNPGGASSLQFVNKNCRWIEAPPLKGALSVNVGNCLIRFTNDKYVSNVHRVFNKSAAAG